MKHLSRFSIWNIGIPSAVFLLLNVFSNPAFSHARLVSPTPRNNSAGLKIAPCGEIPKGTTPTMLIAGSTITVNWQETINHPGRFLFSYSVDNDQTFTQIAEVLDDQDGGGIHNFSTQITVPNITCTNCTFRMVQSMEENPANPSLYFSCADVTILPADTPTTTSTTIETPTTLPSEEGVLSGSLTKKSSPPAFPTGCGSKSTNTSDFSILIFLFVLSVPIWLFSFFAIRFRRN
jgi:hypothetical protein